MGVQITPLIPKRDIDIGELAGKTVAVDAFNTLYQFLTTIRQRDGSLLKDSKGNVTSHLSGLFNRTINLLKMDVRLVFVFDGKTPELKAKERARREALKQDAQKRYQEAEQQEDVDAMRKYAGRTARLTPEMVAEAKRLLDALGVPYVEAPSEGEAQAAELTKGIAFAVASQDADSILFGARRVIKNLTFTPRRKQPGKLAYADAGPELIELDAVLKELACTREQLICLSLLIGTDYNVGGIQGIGPKNAVKLIHQHPDPETLFAAAKWSEHFSYPWQDAYLLFTHPQVIPASEISVSWKKPDAEKVMALMCDEHDFGKERIQKALAELEQEGRKKQKGLSEFF